MPSRARTEEGEHTGPNDGVALGSVDAGGALIARPASRIRQMTPKQNGVSLLSTQVGTRGRSDSLRAFSNGSVKNGQTGFNDSAHIKTTTTTLTPRQRTRSPEDRRHSTGQLLICVPEDAEMSVDQMRASRSSETSRARGISIPRMTQTYYGSTPVTGYPASLEIDNEDDLSEEEEECLLDEELAKSGLFRGNYKNIILLYTFVPLTTLLAFVIFAFLPVFAFHSATPSTFPYPPYFPYPLPEVFTAAALWSLSYLLRDILYETSLLLTSWIPIPSRRFPNFIPFLSSLLAAILQNMSAIVLRQLAVPMLLIPRHSTERPLFDNGALYTAHHNFPTWEDVAFKRVWWVALGWAAAEAVVGIKQGYENIALYKDVLVNVHKMVNGETPATNHPISSTEVTTGIGQAGSSRQKSSESRRPLADREAQNTAEFSRRRDYSSSLSSIASGPYDDLAASTTLERQPLLTLRRQPADNSGMGSGAMAEDADRELVENIVEQDLQELMCLKSREEIEELYGMPVIRIPVFISCLHRINSILASLAVCLILTAAYMRSKFAYDYSHQGHSPSTSSALRYLQLFFPPSPTFHPAIQSSDHPLSGSFITRHPFNPSNHTLIISFSVLLGVHTVFSVLHAPWILPRIGVHTFVYVSLLVWLGLFFGALGFWEALS